MPSISEQFRQLANQWHRDTMCVSSLTDMVNHPAYRQIIQLGPEVVPVLLESLREQPDHWYEALSEITGENPVPPEHRGYIGLMAEDWIAWGRAKGLLEVKKKAP